MKQRFSIAIETNFPKPLSEEEMREILADFLVDDFVKIVSVEDVDAIDLIEEEKKTHGEKKK